MCLHAGSTDRCTQALPALWTVRPLNGAGEPTDGSSPVQITKEEMRPLGGLSGNVKPRPDFSARGMVTTYTVRGYQ